MIMNPNLISSDMVGNFKSLTRIIENVTTYYQNFLSTYQRGLISKELNNLKNESFRFENLKYINLKSFFSSQK